MTHEHSQLPHQPKWSLRKRARQNRGFTIIEVLIVAMLLMIGLAAMSQLIAVTHHSALRRPATE